MFFDDTELLPRKRAALRALAPIPNTGWKVPDYPNLSNAQILSLDVETYDPDLNQAGPGWARGRGHIVGFSIGAQDRSGNRGAHRRRCLQDGVRHRQRRLQRLPPEVPRAGLGYSASAARMRAHERMPLW